MPMVKERAVEMGPCSIIIGVACVDRFLFEDVFGGRMNVGSEDECEDEREDAGVEEEKAEFHSPADLCSSSPSPSSCSC